MPATYTRKSTEEELEQKFNSLDAQRESCEAYVASQKSEGWLLAPDRYDNGGFSGGTLERPALQRLMVDIEAGKVDVVVVYKIARLVEVFDRNAVTENSAETAEKRFPSYTLFGDDPWIEGTSPPGVRCPRTAKSVSQFG